MISQQEFFDRTVQHLIDQKSRCGEYIDDGAFSCLYRDSQQRTCAMGFWIPVELYDPNMENLTIKKLIEEGYELPGVLKQYSGIGVALQSLHDAPQNWDSEGFIGFENAFMLARHYELEWNFSSLYKRG